MAAVGDDRYGAGALELLERGGVDTTHVSRAAGTATGIGFIMVDSSGDNAIAVDLGAVRLGEGMPLDAAAAFACGAGVFSVRSAGTIPSYGTRAQIDTSLVQREHRQAHG